jgi:copper transport protein
MFLALALAGAPRSTAAHAVLLDSAPADGATLTTSPREVRLTFNEPVAPIAVRLLDAAGTAVSATSVEAVDRTVTLLIGRELPAGSYVVSYRVTSQDSHAVAGSIVFAVGTGVVRLEQATGTAADGWRIAFAATRFLWIALSLAAAGLAMFLMLCATTLESDRVHELERRLLIVAVSTLPLGPFAVGLAGALLTDAGAAGLLDGKSWAVGSTTTLARSMAVGFVGLALAALSAGLTLKGVGAPARLIGMLLIVVSFGLTGHAATVEPAVAMGPTVAVHAGLAAFWWGNLLGLGAVLRESPPIAAAPVVRWFSRVAVIAVAALIALGVAIGLVQVRRISALVDPGYGLVLCGKLLLVAGLLAIAGYNKLRLMPRLTGGDVAAMQILRRTVRAETILILAVFAATAALGQLPPPRTQAAAAAITAEATSTKGSRATIEISPGRVGRNEILLRLTDAADRPLAAQEVAFAIALSSAGIEPIRRRLHEVAPGRYHVPELTLPTPGRWSLRVEALVSDFDKRTFTLEVDVR